MGIERLNNALAGLQLVELGWYAGRLAPESAVQEKKSIGLLWTPLQWTTSLGSLKHSAISEQFLPVPKSIWILFSKSWDHPLHPHLSLARTGLSAREQLFHPAPPHSCRLCRSSQNTSFQPSCHSLLPGFLTALLPFSPSLCLRSPLLLS